MNPALLVMRRKKITSDPYFANVSLLLPFTGANNSTVITDSSLNTKGATAIDNAKISTAQSDPFGVSSGVLLLDGTGDLVTVGDSGDFDFGSGDFTAEAFVKFTRTMNNDDVFWIFGQWGATNPYRSWGLLLYKPTGADIVLKLLLSIDGNSFSFYDRTFLPSLDVNHWYFFALVRSGNIFKIYADGAQIGSDISFSGTLYNSISQVGVGATINSGGSPNYLYYSPAFFSNVRITKGIARNLSIVPSSPFPNR